MDDTTRSRYNPSKRYKNLWILIQAFSLGDDKII